MVGYSCIVGGGGDIDGPDLDLMELFLGRRAASVASGLVSWFHI